VKKDIYDFSAIQILIIKKWHQIFSFTGKDSKLIFLQFDKIFFRRKMQAYKHRRD